MEKLLLIFALGVIVGIVGVEVLVCIIADGHNKKHNKKHNKNGFITKT